MKKLNLICIVLITLLAIVSCSDEEKINPKMQFTAATETYNLEMAGLYLKGEFTWEGRTYREYVISDGNYTNAAGGRGGALGDYEGATFFLLINLSSSVNGQLTPGEYPQYGTWTAAEDDSKISLLHMHSEVNGYFLIKTHEGSTLDKSPVIVKGGFEDGSKMTIEFEGPLEFDDINSIEPTQSVLGKIYFSGKVQDKRDL